MPSTPETGHAKNVAHFNSLISFCGGYGSAYNPANAALSLASLQSLLATSQNRLTAVATAKAAYDSAIYQRAEAFDDLARLCTRIVNAYAVSGASENATEGVKSMNRRLQGRRAAKVPTTAPAAEGTVIKTVSASRQSYDQQAANFAQLLALLQAEPLYKPNETGLQLATLKSRLAEMNALNAALNTAYTAYSNALISRDEALYGEGDGLVGIAADVKMYVRSVFGAASPQYKQVSGLAFRAIKKGN